MENTNELREAIEELSARLDDLNVTVEDAVRDAVEDAVNCAIENSMPNGVTGAAMYVLSQDGKTLVPFLYAQAVRIKKGEEPYAINVSTGNMQLRMGKYENKAAALEEMKKIADALRHHEEVYRMK